MWHQSRFREQPMAWTGLATMLAAWVWPVLEPSWLHCGLGTVGMCSLGYRVRALPWAWIPTMCGVVFFTWAIMSDRPVEPSTRGAWNAHGTVLDRVGRFGLVESSSGMFFLRFSDDGPKKGDEVLFWSVSEDCPDSMAGSWDVSGMARRARARCARTRDWVGVGAPAHEREPIPQGRHSGSLSGLLLGDVDWLTVAEETLLRRTGTRHLMAVSGLHLGLAAGLAAGICSLTLRLFIALGVTLNWRVMRVLCGAAAFVAARQYAVIAGWSISSQRALWMIALATLGLCFGRRVSGWSLLGGAVTMLMWVQPWQVTRPGFLLSVGAVAGIFGLAPLFSRWIPPDWSSPLRWTLHSMSISLGAALGTLPISAWVFQEWSVVGPLANLWAGPMVSLWIVPLALLGLCTQGELSEWCWWFAEYGLDLFWSGLWLLDFPLWHPALSDFGAVALCMAIFSLRYWWSWLVVVCLLWGPRGGPTGELVVQFLNVGQGDSTLIRWPDGRLWLVDGGPPSEQVLFWLRRQGVMRLDVVILTHPDQDHLGGLIPVAEHLEVGQLWISRWPQATESDFRQLVRTVRREGTSVWVGDQIPATEIMPSNPLCDSRNDCGLVLELEYGHHRFLLMGDVGHATEQFLLPRLRPVDVLKVGHHGSNYSTSTPFLERVSPVTSVISVGGRNPYGHPGSSALWRLRSSRILRTDWAGTITVQSDGKDLTWQTDHSNTWSVDWFLWGI